jgi:hypothetical protein
MNSILNSNERGWADLVVPNTKKMALTLGCSDPNRQQDCVAKAGPAVADNGLWVTDAPFPSPRFHSLTLYQDRIQ